MNIICVQIPSGKLYQALSSQIRFTNWQICNELWFDMKVGKKNRDKWKSFKHMNGKC
jgi:hypothetical protein